MLLKRSDFAETTVPMVRQKKMLKQNLQVNTSRDIENAQTSDEFL